MALSVAFPISLQCRYMVLHTKPTLVTSCTAVKLVPQPCVQHGNWIVDRLSTYRSSISPPCSPLPQCNQSSSIKVSKSTRLLTTMLNHINRRTDDSLPFFWCIENRLSRFFFFSKPSQIPFNSLAARVELIGYEGIQYLFYLNSFIKHKRRRLLVVAFSNNTT